MQPIDDIQINAYHSGVKLTAMDVMLSQKQIDLVGKGNYVLDIGCNDGSLTQEIAKNNKTVGLELSKGAVDLAKKKGLDVEQGSVYALPFENETFDVVHFSEVIEHLLDTNKALQEIYRVLKKGGKLVVTTPNCCSFRDRILVLFGHLQAYAQHTEHVRLFNLARLKKHLINTNFEIEKIAGSGFSFPLGSGRATFTCSLDNFLPPTLLQRLVVIANKPK